MFDLSGRTALVTGSGRGIGEVTAKALAAHGAAVVTHDLTSEPAEAVAEAIRGAGGRAAAVGFDVTDYEAVTAGIAEAERVLSPIDILVANAGGTPDKMWPTTFRRTPRESWPAFLGMNLVGVMNCTHVLVEGMIGRGFGRLIEVSSDAARVGNVGSSIYGAAKAGAEGFMRTLAKELGPKGITANSVVLGLIDTVPKEFLEQSGAADLYPMRRVGTPRDVAAGVVYLASDEAGWVTGHSLVINGGGIGG